MKNIDDIYDKYMTINQAEKVVKLCDELIPMLRTVRDERTYQDLHNSKTYYTVSALDHWEELKNEFSKFIKDNK